MPAAVSCTGYKQAGSLFEERDICPFTVSQASVCLMVLKPSKACSLLKNIPVKSETQQAPCQAFMPNMGIGSSGGGLSQFHLPPEPFPPPFHPPQHPPHPPILLLTFLPSSPSLHASQDLPCLGHGSQFSQGGANNMPHGMFVTPTTGVAVTALVIEQPRAAQRTLHPVNDSIICGAIMAISHQLVARQLVSSFLFLFLLRICTHSVFNHKKSILKAL